ncbi:alpha/beta hydrolase [Kribbella catacumbae]|uniref:alpha/beta hydrolase n=1 Tax=Kribbella catacumbae TaxID=460086 RepID=UPI00036EF1B5|nr:alpha/beta hydrolase-fold protein [Kribbella catacumbae]
MLTSISPRIGRLFDEYQGLGAVALDKFWREVAASGAPLIEEPDENSALVTFVWRGTAESTSVTWGVNLPLHRFVDSDLWFGSVRLPLDLRTLYYFCHDGADALPVEDTGRGLTHVDAHNAEIVHLQHDPHDETDWDCWASLLELPAAPDELWSVPRMGVPHGSVTEEFLPSTALRDTRCVSVYQPPGVRTDGLPLLVIFDGYIGKTLLRIPTTLDNLIAAGKIPPVVALFVHGRDDRRSDELTPTQPILDFATRELLPWARRRWRVSEDPSQCVISGASLGGLTAAFIGLRAPDCFGAVLSQSGCFWWPAPDQGQPELLIRQYAAEPRKPLRLYLDVGDRETMSVSGPGFAATQLSVNRKMRDTLLDQGYDVSYAEYRGGHDPISWRRTIADGLVAVLGR